MMAFQLTPEPDLCSWFRTLLQGLAPILSSKDLLSFWEIDPEQKMFQEKISKVQDFLNNAEQRRSQEICVSNWMDNLRELLYDMEDFVDEMNIEHLRMKEQVASRNQSAPGHGFWDDIEVNRPQKDAIKRRLADVLKRLDNVVKVANELELKPPTVGGGSVSKVDVRVHEDNVGASVDESDVYGREKDKDRIIEQLLDPTDSSRKNYAVISIVGMGGLGKTTLAKLIFNDQRIRDNFGTRSWACVSDVFDFNRVVKELIEYATPENVSNMATPTLCRLLETKVQDKKILIVLDDLWKAEAWDRLKASFTRCASGSKILVTTRDKNVGEAISNKVPYELGILEDEHCWNLFEEKAFASWGVIDGSLEKIGRGIVKKCGGIPLAIKVIGSFLRFAPEEMWEKAWDSELWQSVNQEKIFPALKLSYHYLPSPLKRCFGYLSLFPTDFELNQQQVVRLWIAEGLVESRADMLWEDIGKGYYHELQRRCLIQKDGKMHDLILNLARDVVSRKFSYSCAANGGTGLSMDVGSIRHLSLTGDDHLDLNAFEESKHLRTFLLFMGRDLHKIPEWSLRLRVLDLGGNFMAEELLDFIGSLKHLRYLNLSWNKKLKELPDSIFKLHHLQALDLYYCSGLRGLPSDIGNLGSLRYLRLTSSSVSVLPSSIAQLAGLIELDLGKCNYLTCIPEGIGSLQNLRTLNLRGTPIVSLPDSISKLQKLQVLDLSYCWHLLNLPDQIGCLGGLRMLNLQCTPLSHLPKSIGKLHNLRSLNVLRNYDSEQPTPLSEDICNLSSLEVLVFDCSWVRLPQGIGKLRNLKRLEEYSVGKEAGRGIEELKDMNKLEGSLAISQLENVESVEKALGANLKSKIYIDELQLDWRSSPGTPSASDDEDDDTKSGDNGKSEMEEKVLDALEPHPKGLKGLSLLNYHGGRTPKWMSDLRFLSLKDLRMKGLVCMETVMDIELPSLESLKIRNCPELRVVSMVLPNLKELLITRCQELKALCMSSSLIIQDWSSASDHRSYSRMELPQLVEIRMEHCPRVAICMTMPKLEELIMEDCGELTLMGFTDIVLEGGPSSDIEIKNYKGRWLPLLAEDDEDKAVGSTLFFPNVGGLKIENCRNLAVLPKALHTIASLRTLDIINCPRLVSFPGLPPMLKALRIKSCTNLQHLPTDLGDLTYLKELRMEGFVCMERVMDIELPSLESLTIKNCPELRVVSMGLPNLKKLLITRCQELKALCMSPSLISQDCCSTSDHRSYSRMELPQLVEIRLEHCPSLRVAICMTMPKLEGLFMDDCGELTLMGFTDIVLEGGPSSDIEFKNYKGPWLPRLAEDDENKAAGSALFFPNVGRLSIENCPNLAVLPKALKTIASLRTLYISNCPQLASFPKLPPMLESLVIKSCTNLQHLPTSLGDLTNLQLIHIIDCPRLEVRPEDRLPPNLKRICFFNCPQIKEQLKREERKDWLDRSTFESLGLLQ